jgi:hypothetical protein
MTTTNTSTGTEAGVIAQQVTAWRRERDRLQDLIDTATGSVGTEEGIDLDRLTRWTFDGGMTAAVAKDGQWLRYDDAKRALARRAAPLAHPIGQGSADPILATWPERIWLNNGDTDERQDYGTAREVFGNAMTWSADQIDSLDVEYVRADLAPSSTDSAQAAVEDQALEKAAKAAEETDVATFTHAMVLHDDGSQTRSDIAKAIRALKSTAAQAATEGDKS